MKSCDKYEDLIARFIHGAILLHEKEELEGHLAVCAACEKLYSEATVLDRALRDLPGKAVEPPPWLASRIVANLPAEAPAPAERRWWGWAAGLAATAACALLAVSLFRAHTPGEPRLAAPGKTTTPAVGAPVSPPPGKGPVSVARAPSAKPPAPVQVIREVKIYFYYPPAQKVAVTGDFNGWNAEGVPLTPAGKPGLWVTNLRLKPGAYSYNFIVDGDVLVPDPAAPTQMPDGYGGTNSILLVKGDRSA